MVNENQKSLGRSVQCNENTYVKENPWAIEEYDIIETAENDNKYE